MGLGGFNRRNFEFNVSKLIDGDHPEPLSFARRLFYHDTRTHLAKKEFRSQPGLGQG
jgi:hypothetical protein